MKSLNEIISLLSERVNKPFDVPFQEELKTIVSYKRARVIKNSLKTHPHNRKYMQQTFVTELEEVPKVECPVTYGCVLRTKCKVPTTIDANGILFDYVGTATWDKPYTYTKAEFESYMSSSPYTGKSIRYELKDGYIYIYNTKKLKYIGVRGIFEDPRDIQKCHCGDASCYSDDDAYPLTESLLDEVIKAILSTELRAYMPEQDVEIKVNPDATNQR